MCRPQSPELSGDYTSDSSFNGSDSGTYNSIEEDCQFSICLEEEPHDIISNAKYIIMKMEGCVCCTWIDPFEDYFIVNNRGRGITVELMLIALSEQCCSPPCNHRFLEGFVQIGDSNIYDLCFGS
tara:strand:+ start:2324 stop:2698 length:375 start_codon:yes stop_codon:yes gene_type:complete